MKTLKKVLFVLLVGQLELGTFLSSAVRAEETSNQPLEGEEVCLRGARDVILVLEQSDEFSLNQNIICDEESTEFLDIRVTRRSGPRVPTGLPQLFWQRTPGHLTAIREGREPRLNYMFTPYDAPNMWAITVTDSLGNRREDRDYFWARDLRDGIDGTAKASLILGEPLVYFECTGARGLTCVASYNIDKCYGDPEFPKGSSAQNRRYYQLSVIAYGPENVELMFADYEPINQLAERLLQLISPSACAYEEYSSKEKN